MSRLLNAGDVYEKREKDITPSHPPFYSKTKTGPE
jgi:hypothetical protein